MRYDSPLAAVGNTPLVRLPRLSPSEDVRIWAKLEDRNPTGSVKDRPALHMIEQAEKDGRLTPGCTILEPTSGNTGISLAMAAKLKGYRIVCVMPENTSSERRELLAMWGAEIISSPAAGGSNTAVKVAKELSAEHPDWVMLYQYGNPDNAGAHYATTGPEILADLLRHPFRGRSGHHRHAHGRRPLSARAGPRRPDRRRRTALRRCRLRSAQPRRGLHPRALRRVRAHHPLLGRLRGRGPPHPRTPRRGRHLRGHLHRRGTARRDRRRQEGGQGGEPADVVFVVADGGWKYLSTGVYTAESTEAAIATLHGQLWA